MKIPAKSALEAAAELKPPAPTPPPAPLASFVLDPSRVAARSRCVGNYDPVRMATHHLGLECVENLQWIEGLAPDLGKQVRDELAEGEELKRRATDKLEAFTAKAHALKEAIVARGDARKRLAEVQAELAKAKATLADKSCLRLPAGELIRLTLAQTHLPAEAAEWQAKIDEAEKTIKLIEREGRFTAAVLVPDMVKRASVRVGANNVTDPHIVALKDWF